MSMLRIPLPVSHFLIYIDIRKVSINEHLILATRTGRNISVIVKLLSS